MVMAGPVPATPINMAQPCLVKRDGRVKPGHDDLRNGTRIKRYFPGCLKYRRSGGAWSFLIGMM